MNFNLIIKDIYEIRIFWAMKKIAFEDLGSGVELVDRLDWGLMQWWDQNGCDAQLLDMAIVMHSYWDVKHINGHT